MIVIFGESGKDKAVPTGITHHSWVCFAWKLKPKLNIQLHFRKGEPIVRQRLHPNGFITIQHGA